MGHKAKEPSILRRIMAVSYRMIRDFLCPYLVAHGISFVMGFVFYTYAVWVLFFFSPFRVGVKVVG